MIANLLNATSAYRNQKPRVQQDATAAISRVPSLQARVGQLGTANGQQHTLLFLSGTIPIFFKGCQYNIPVNIWFGANYPYSAPLAYVIPVQGMALKPRHKHVDANGMVYLPYLNQWNSSRSNIHELVTYMSSVFSSDPPVYAVSNNNNQNQNNTPPIQQHQQQQNNNNNMNNVMNNPIQEIKNTPRSSFSNNQFQQQQQQSIILAQSSASTEKAQLKMQLVQRISASLQDKYREFNSDGILELDRLFVAQGRLQDSKARIRKVISAIETENKQLISLSEQYINKCCELQTWIDENDHKEDINLTDVLQYQDTWSEQLFEAVAEDYAIEDTLYVLDKLLADDAIELEDFLKEVRSLARKQFQARALAKVIAMKRQELM